MAASKQSMQARTRIPGTPEERRSQTASRKPETEKRGAAADPRGGFDVASVLTAAGEAAYQWNLGTDAMVWSANTRQLLQMDEPGPLTTGKAFALHIDPKHASRRREVIAAAAGDDRGLGAPYRLQYRLQPKGRRNPSGLWIEEQGRCYASAEGQGALAVGVVRVINDRHEEEERLLYLSQYDQLTGQLNRVKLTELVQTRLEQMGPKRRSAAFLMAGLNNLGHINDTFGFGTGDEVLAVVGRRLKSCLRAGDSIGRYGSNKFGLLIDDCGPAEVAGIADRLIRAVRESVVKTSAGAVPASVCIGGVLMPQHAGTVQTVLGRSLEALDWIRSRYGTSFALYQPSEKRESRRRRNMAIAEQVIRALNEGRMLFALQPVVTAGSRRPVFYECLLRMCERDGSLVAAEEFIPVAEQLGLVGMIDHRAACLAVELLEANPDLKVGINISGETAMGGEWLELLRNLTRGDRSLTGRITVEITETAAISDIAETVKFVTALKELGCKIAIDDFGTGYWSFRALRFLEPDLVKIDGSFIRNLAHSTDDWLFVRALLDLARNFGMETVAEWVEDETTAKMLEHGGITYMQGFLFGAPTVMTQPGKAETA